MDNKIFEVILQKLLGEPAIADDGMVESIVTDSDGKSYGVTADQVFQHARREFILNMIKVSQERQEASVMGVAILVFDSDGRASAINETAREMLDLTGHIDINTAFKKFNISLDMQKLTKSDQRFHGDVFEVGGGRFIQILSLPIVDSDGKPSGFVCLVQDAMSNVDLVDEVLKLSTETEERYREELERQRRSDLILKTVIEANSSLILDEVLTSAATSLAETIGAPFCGIYLMGEEEDLLSMRGRTGHLKDSGLLKEIKRLPLKTSDALAKAAMASEGPLVIEDAQNSELIREDHKHYLGLKSLVVIQLMARGKILGLAMLPTFDGRVSFDQEKLDIASAIAKAVGLAIDNAQLFQKSQELAVIEERNRLAQEIHDGLAQRLTGVVLQLEAAELLTGQNIDEAAKRIKRAKDLARESLEEARRSVWDLRPKPLEEHSLSVAVRKEVDLLAQDINVKASFNLSGKATRLSQKVENFLLRMLQETLGNIRRHANAKSVEVYLDFKENSINLFVSDDGIGFDPVVELKRNEGYGLSGLKERASELGGTCWIDSQAGDGTSIQIQLPLVEPATTVEGL